MIEWWEVILVVLATCVVLILTFALLVLVFILGTTLYLFVAKKLAKVFYARAAHKSNEAARLKRLEMTEYRGYPLPTGRKGMLHITRKMMLDNPQRVSQTDFDRAYEYRALDLWVQMESSDDFNTGDLIFRWRPRKDRRPREHY